ncbi:hypothetical protein HZA98_04945 [Candidatus Woesearchaeota archaeon]|nr:hypothetical protein [Candidatus Woesearchaeota archaeon]
MKQEKKLEAYIHKNAWNLNYHNAEVTDIWGTNYQVTIKPAGSCFALPYSKVFDREITLSTPCQYTVKQFNISETEYLAQELAHETGHLDTWIPSATLTGLILFAGIRQMKKTRSFLKPFLYTILALGAKKTVIDETLAEVAAQYIHKSNPTGEQFHKGERNPSNFINGLEHLIEG